MSASRPLVTVAETAAYLAASSRLFDDEERSEIVAFLAGSPTAGDLIVGTGGVRKLRWARKGTGKRGGARVIYFFHSDQMPLYLLTAFGKNQKANLTKAERNSLASLVAQLVSVHSSRRKP